MNEWFRNEKFWESTYPFMFTEERLGMGEEQVGKILNLVDFNGKRILDLCCGPGRHAIPLARKGFEVTAVDASNYLLKKGKERARQEQVEIEWMHEDMRKFVRPGAYDLVLNFFTSFGYFDDRDEDLGVLKNISSSLKPGGSLMLELMSKEMLALNFQPTISERLIDGSTLIHRLEIFDSWTRVRNEWTVIREGAADTFLFDLNLYSAQEIRDRLEAAGFSTVRIFGDLDGNDYDIEAKRLTVVAGKGA